MVSVLIIAHSEIANSFAYCLEHIMNKRVDNLVILPIKKSEAPDSIYPRAEEIIERQLRKADGVLILCDIFGATPSNIASKLIEPNRVELITGLNLPMLIRAITYSNQSLDVCVSKALDGGISGIIHLKGE
ncbi:MAG: PTS fructose transporter subunit IIA [Burkholderiales bacterium]|jgi:PTS system mannose-specific IIA component|nr:PTS fructose transporter subunit IIA [Burkholderiales bacterium]